MNKVRFAKKDEIAHWDKYLEKNPGTQNFFQEKTFLSLKAQQSISPWQVRYVVHTIDEEDIYVAYLVKRIIGLGEYWYAPFGPQATTTAQVNEIINQLRHLAPKAFIVLLEPSILVDSSQSQREVIASLPGASYAAPVQPNVHTIVVTIKEEDAMFSAFKQRTRRAIRQAQKAEVVVKKMPYSQATKDQFYALYSETAKRQGFYIRVKSYYEKFWDTYSQAQQAAFFFAYKNDDLKNPIAGVFILYDKKKALYKDGASVRDGLPNGTLHLLQWEVLQWLRKKGVSEYDLHGVPPSWLQTEKDHRQYGLGVFKSSFGETIDLVGAVQWDIKPLRAKLWHYGVRKLYHAVIARRGGFFF